MTFSPAVSLFFTLLQRAVGHNTALPEPVSAEVWQAVYAMSRQQALVGIVFMAVEKLPKTQMPPRELLLKWLVQTDQIEARNRELNELAVMVTEKVAAAGFRSVILKGQGIARLYPMPLRRTSGDIDIWLDGNRDGIMQYVRTNAEHYHAAYHHVECPLAEGAEVEVHFTPSWMNDFLINRRLQHFFYKQAPEQFAQEITGGIGTPTLAFNRIYILLHLYRHLFEEGIGLRQFLDYYYVLHQGFTEEERAETLGALKELRLRKFAAAVMYVLQTVFGLEAQYLLLAPNASEGRLLLDEIMLAGNFGQYDHRIVHKKRGAVGRFSLHVFRSFRFVQRYPAEVLWSPVFKLYHFWKQEVR